METLKKLMNKFGIKNIPNKISQLEAWWTEWNKLKIEYQEQKTK
jgi:hypothetical protein